MIHISATIRRGERARPSHIVALSLIPVEWLDWSDSAVAWNGLRLAIIGVGATSTSQAGLANGRATGVASDLALEAVHIHWEEK